MSHDAHCSTVRRAMAARKHDGRTHSSAGSQLPVRLRRFTRCAPAQPSPVTSADNLADSALTISVVCRDRVGC